MFRKVGSILPYTANPSMYPFTKGQPPEVFRFISAFE
jgi:hypothetical protein